MKVTPKDTELAFSGSTQWFSSRPAPQLVLVDDTDVADGEIPGQMALGRSPSEREGFQFALALYVRPMAPTR